MPFGLAGLCGLLRLMRILSSYLDSCLLLLVFDEPIHSDLLFDNPILGSPLLLHQLLSLALGLVLDLLLSCRLVFSRHVLLPCIKVVDRALRVINLYEKIILNLRWTVHLVGDLFGKACC